MRPAAPSSTAIMPVRAASSTPGTPSTAGTASARSMMAVWPSAPPSSVAKPATRAGSIRAASAGRNVSATRMAPCGRAAKLRNPDWVRLRSRRRPVSRISSARRWRDSTSSRRAGDGRQHGLGQGLDLVQHRGLGGDVGFGDAPARLAQQPGGAEHLQVGVDQRRDLVLAVLRQHGQPGAQLAQLAARFLHGRFQPGELRLDGVRAHGGARDLDLRLARRIDLADGDARADRYADQDPFRVGRRRAPAAGPGGTGLLSPAH